MKNTTVIFNAQRKVRISRQLRDIIRKAVDKTLELERIDYPCEVSVKLVTDAGIKKLNRDFRDTDSATDVLSFPAEEPVPSDGSPRFLGDMAIAVDFAGRQAQAAGGTFEHEIALLTAHSVLHLLGYDHAEPDQEREMFAKQEQAVKMTFDGETT